MKCLSATTTTTTSTTTTTATTTTTSPFLLQVKGMKIDEEKEIEEQEEN